jgi:hypothetical protein
MQQGWTQKQKWTPWTFQGQVRLTASFSGSCSIADASPVSCLVLAGRRLPRQVDQRCLVRHRARRWTHVRAFCCLTPTRLLTASYWVVAHNWFCSSRFTGCRSTSLLWGSRSSPASSPASGSKAAAPQDRRTAFMQNSSACAVFRVLSTCTVTVPECSKLVSWFF